MSNTKFTIVIPTRDRAENLIWSLKTCTTQDYDNLTIVVSDNQSSDDTEDVVRSADDERIRYIKTPSSLSMTHSWEFGLDHVSEGFVSFCGDDDGYLPGALAQVDEYVKQSGTQAIGQVRDGYAWPTFTIEGQQNRLTVSLGEDFEVLNSRDEIQSAMENPTKYMNLPIIYKGFVDMGVIAEFKHRSSSPNFFRSMVPDVFSGLAIAGTTRSYGFTHRPFALNGASSHSTGTAEFHTAPKEEKFVKESKVPFHPRLVFAPSIPIILGECMLQLQDVGMLTDHEVDIETLMRSAMTVATHGSRSDKAYSTIESAVREIGRRNEMVDSAEAAISAVKRRFSARTGYVEGLDMLNRRISVDASKHGVTNIYEASVLYEEIRRNRFADYKKPLAVARTTAGLAINELKRLRS